MAGSSPPVRPPRAVSRRKDVSVLDVARRARVSLGTVSRVINDHPGVARELRERVLLACRRIGFVPRGQMRSLAVVTGRFSPGLPIGYTSIMTSLVWRFLADKGVPVELIDVANLDQTYQASIAGVIGVVFDDRLLELKKIPNLPILTINRPMLDQGIHSVRADHYQQARLAAEHLLAHGHRQIGFLAIQPDEWGSQERLRGYQDALYQAGFEPAAPLAQYTLRRPVYDILGQWMRQGVTGLLNFSEDTSLEVLHILTNVLNLRIGTDVSVVSLEDLPVYHYLNPPQTTVRQPLAELARLAVEKMLELCNPAPAPARKNGHVSASAPMAGAGAIPGERPLVDICLPGQLVVRESVASCAAAGQAGTLST